MVSSTPVRIAGILMLGVFAINMYIGLKDTNLIPAPAAGNVTHYYLNWLMALVDIIAAAVLIIRPLSRLWVLLGGVIWPIVYVAGLAYDVQIKLGGLFKTRSAAFDYLILGSSSQGWVLWQYIMETAITLLFIVFVISVLSLVANRAPQRPLTKTQPAPGPEMGRAPGSAPT